MRSRKPAKIVDAHFLDNGDVVLTFTRPHGATAEGAIMQLSNGTHTVVEVRNKFILVARRWKWYTAYVVRARAAWAILYGRPKLKRAVGRLKKAFA
ncbi:MAG: hypothetical protein M3348_00075 [Acidobacteriota bacterium]|nr:hypothetical protein [Acidobacteriota bacterium]